MLVLALGCAGGQTAPVVPEAGGPPVEPASPERPGWWTAPSPCPDGASLVGKPPPAGDEVVCQRPDGTRHGRMTWWSGNGTKLSEGEYIDDVPTGHWVVWYENGNRKTQGSYDNGKEVGRWYGWDQDGNITTDVTMVEGRRHGPWTWYHANGRKAGEGEFSNGKPHGIWIRWDASGQIKRVEEYDNDRLVRSNDYENGQPVAQAQAP